MHRIFCALFLMLTLALLPGGQAWSSSSLYVPESGSLFWLDILDEGETYHDDDRIYATNGVLYSDFTLSAAERSSLSLGLEYWRLVLEDGATNTSPLRILVQTVGENDDNASARSPILDEGDAAGKTYLSGALADDWFGYFGTDWEDALALITIDHAMYNGGEWYSGPMASLPRNGTYSDLAGTLVHEVMHALGLTSSAYIDTFGTSLNLWDQGLRDIYGQQAAPGMEIVVGGEPGEGVFVTASGDAYSGVYFTGEHVAEVLNGAMLSFPENPDGTKGSYSGTFPGLPVNGWEGGEAEFSHIELQNSLMSHQSYRNWNTLMEAELAVMQDLGLSLDRRTWYGCSIYNSGITFTNTNPYYAREDGQWLVGQPSTTPWGVGLHVYGSDNTITQAADLLADGSYALGIRLEGENNSLTVAEGTRVQASGLEGTALLVSYGSGHAVSVEGEAVALGEDGIAARFDFGDNTMGNYWEYRGSWMRTTGCWDEDLYPDVPAAIKTYVEHATLPGELKGPLVTSFNVTGLLAGSAAAIYIGDNALVEQINILSGASIQGDIISYWDPQDSRIQAEEYGLNRDDLYTRLTFGQTLNADGTFTDDGNFALTLYGSIQGSQGIRMYQRAGRLEVLGTVQVASLENYGTLALYGTDDSGIAVAADSFVNAAGATLETGFWADGSVTSVQAGTAVIDGALALRPMADFYASGTAITISSPLTAGTSTGEFSDIVLAAVASPTLTFSLRADGLSSMQATASRSRTAYSRYADTETGGSVGRALASVADTAEGDMRNLFTALDWSAADGSTVRGALNQLGPEAYDSAARASLAQQREFNILLLRRMLADWTQRRENGPAEKAPEAETWTAWAIPYGAGAWQGGSGETSSWTSSGLGLLAGMDRSYDSGLTVGLHVALAARRTDVNGDHDAQAETMSGFVGAQALLAPQTWDGCWLTGQARIGLESGEMERNVSFNGYRRHNESRWTGTAGSALLGGGRDWSIDLAGSSLVLGPLGWLEYAFLQRPEITERDGQASRLTVDGAVYESLLLSLGGHVGWSTALENGGSAGVDLLAAWRHELLDGTFRTSASFRGHGGSGFESASELSGRDAMLLQAGLKASHPAGFTAQLEVGGEFFRQDAAAVNVGLSFGWEF